MVKMMNYLPEKFEYGTAEVAVANNEGNDERSAKIQQLFEGLQIHGWEYVSVLESQNTPDAGREYVFLIRRKASQPSSYEEHGAESV